MISSHLKRWLTALVALPLLTLLVGKGGQASFTLFVGLTAAVALFEYYSLALPHETQAIQVVGSTLGLVLVASFYTGSMEASSAVLIAAILVFAMLSVARFDSQAHTLETFCKQVTGLLYVPYLLGHMILIRAWDQGVTWIFFLMVVIFAGDTAAFYIGRAFGRHKLSPNVSPGKTVEGALGGLTANLLIGALFKTFYFPELSWGYLTALVMIMGALGQAGDLVESTMKRSVGVKDSGGIMPGHGGLLDRIDALLFATPALYYVKTYLL
jgi:phosphatidate cytidylyltransferase